MRLIVLINMLLTATISSNIYWCATKHLPDIAYMIPISILIGHGAFKFIADFESSFCDRVKFKQCFIAGILAPLWLFIRKPALKWMAS